MTLKKFLKEFYGNNPICLHIQLPDHVEVVTYNRCLDGVEKSGFEKLKVLAVYPWSSQSIGITCKGV